MIMITGKSCYHKWLSILFILERKQNLTFFYSQIWINFYADDSRHFSKCCFPSYSFFPILFPQERVIENLREQKEREDRARLEELEQMRKENQELKDKLAAVQPQKLSQSQLANPGLTQTQRPEVGINILTLLSFKGDFVFLISAVTKFGHHVVIIC